MREPHMKIENILSKARLAFPDDIVLLKPEIVSKRLHEKAGISEDEIPVALSMLFASALASAKFADTVPPGLNEGAVDAFKILVTARLVSSLDNVKPSIATVAKFSKLSRNLVSPCVRFLESFDLIRTEPHVRGQLVLPTALTNLYIDVISGNLKEEYNLLEEVANEAKSGELSSKSLEFLENLETAFHMTKLAYNGDTINYEIMKDLHDKTMKLVVEAREGKCKEITKNLDEFLEVIGHIINVRKKANEMGIRPVILENTGERLGRARVFRVK